MRIAVLALALGLCPTIVRAGDEPRLVPHKAVYDLSLVKAGGMRPVESARGRIVFEFKGSACKGWNLDYRQVTVLESGETGTRVSDLRNTTQESGDGTDFRFRTQTLMDGKPGAAVEGRAARQGDALRVSLRAPKADAFTAAGTILFPSAQMRRLIAAAQAGEKTLNVKVFDGSDDGRKIYDTLAVIGAPRRDAEDAGVEAPIRATTMRGATHWPVTLSYFNAGRGDGTPIYALGFDLYENGVSGALRLDYGDFVLKGETSQLDLLPEDKSCSR